MTDEMMNLELRLPRFGGRFAGHDGLIRPSYLLSYSIGERYPSAEWRREGL